MLLGFHHSLDMEERCFLPDGTIYELRDIWTADSTTEE
jgi:hypothetical protein